ncbi:type II toxin-antitoxin system prevent-host-death family antitoxin [Caulobacter sp. SLTY]|nr:type II toxin-antitoxin system prevent-host-death family antitoxin [Caulobacter sp. SLTY]
MAVQMNIAEAKAKLSDLVARAEAGEEVVIARDGTPAVVLHPARPRKRRLGGLAHLGPAPPLEAFLEADPDAEAAMFDQPAFPAAGDR